MGREGFKPYYTARRLFEERGLLPKTRSIQTSKFVAGKKYTDVHFRVNIDDTIILTYRDEFKEEVVQGKFPVFLNRPLRGIFRYVIFKRKGIRNLVVSDWELKGE